MQSLIFSTIPIFDEKPYLKEIYSTIIKIDEDAVLIDQSIFYPVGGGQLGDTGTITVENNIYKVVDTFKDNNLGIWLKLDSAISPDLVGKKIHTKIDWDRRYKLMQMHTCIYYALS